MSEDHVDDDSSWQSLDESQSIEDDRSKKLPSLHTSAVPSMEDDVQSRNIPTINVSDDDVGWEDLDTKHDATANSHEKVTNFAVHRLAIDGITSHDEDNNSAFENLTGVEHHAADAQYSPSSQQRRSSLNESSLSNDVFVAQAMIPWTVKPTKANIKTRSNDKIPSRPRQDRRRSRSASPGNHNDAVQFFWSRFFVHFAREIWQSDIRIRLALTCIAFGGICNSLRWSLWCLYCPRQIIGALLLVIPILYLKLHSIQNSINLLSASMQSPESLVAALADLEPGYLRHVYMIAMFLVPLVVDISTVHLLSQCHSQLGRNDYNFAMGCLLLVVMLYQWKVANSPLRSCTQTGLFILYGSALSLSIYWSDLRRFPLLAGPFLVPTGALLFRQLQNQNPEWLSTSVQAGLRHTVRDSLQEVSARVQEDEMLQMTMLRWIVDYWASVTDRNGTKNPENTSTSPSGPAAPQNPTPNCQTNRPSSQSSAQEFSTMNTLRLKSRNEIDWDSLCSMLSVTTDQMAVEIASLQDDRTTSNPSQSVHSTTSNALCLKNHTNGSNSISAYNGSKSKISSLESLHATFAYINIDEKLKPAVVEYKRNVNAFPPSREMSVLVSVARRCPAFILLIWQVFFGQLGSLSSTIIVCVLISFELLRIYFWFVCCTRIGAADYGRDFGMDNTRHFTYYIEHIDPMVLLLADDSTNNRPALLVVWQNIQSSVTALEVGLTASRCLQTVNATAEFVTNIVSLVHFGFEISENGWLHGLAIIAKEIATIYFSGNGDIGSPRCTGTKYTNAAVGTIKNSEVISRNIQTMLEEDQMSNILQPVLDFMPKLVGKGWLWGHTDAGVEQQDSHSNRENENNGTKSATEEKVVADGEEQESHSMLEKEDKGTEDSSEEKVDADTTEAVSVAVNNAPDCAISDSQNDKEPDQDEISGAQNISVILQIDSLNASSLREQASQTEQSDEFLSIAKRSKWMTTDVMEFKLPLVTHLSTENVEETSTMS